jgi:hypothetical protein
MSGLFRTGLPISGGSFFSERSDRFEERRRIERRKYRFPGESFHFLATS